MKKAGVICSKNVDFSLSAAIHIFIYHSLFLHLKNKSYCLPHKNVFLVFCSNQKTLEIAVEILLDRAIFIPNIFTWKLYIKNTIFFLSWILYKLIFSPSSVNQIWIYIEKSIRSISKITSKMWNFFLPLNFEKSVAFNFRNFKLHNF